MVRTPVQNKYMYKVNTEKQGKSCQMETEQAAHNDCQLTLFVFSRLHWNEHTIEAGAENIV